MTDLHNFNAGRKSWKMYAKELTSINGDNLTITPYDGEDLILEVSGNGNILFKEDGITYNLADLSNAASAGDISLVNYVVTVASKTSNHPYDGTGSGSGYFLNGLLEAPTLLFEVGKTYRFKQDDSTNGGHQIRFYNDAGRTSAYSTNVSLVGTAGNAYSYSEIFITPQTANVLYYQCVNHGYMGGKIIVSNTTLSQLLDTSAAHFTAINANTTLLSATAGTATISKALIVDSNKDISGIRNITNNGLLTSESINTTTFTFGANGSQNTLPGIRGLSGQYLQTDGNGTLIWSSLSGDTIENSSAVIANTTLLSATAGTAAISKALIVDSNKDISGIRNITSESINTTTFTFGANGTQNTLPGIRGLSGQYLQTDGNGTLIWSSISANSTEESSDESTSDPYYDMSGFLSSSGTVVSYSVTNPPMDELRSMANIRFPAYHQFINDGNYDYNYSSKLITLGITPNNNYNDYTMKYIDSIYKFDVSNSNYNHIGTITIPISTTNEQFETRKAEAFYFVNADGNKLIYINNNNGITFLSLNWSNTAIDISFNSGSGEIYNAINERTFQASGNRGLHTLFVSRDFEYVFLISESGKLSVHKINETNKTFDEKVVDTTITSLISLYYLANYSGFHTLYNICVSEAYGGIYNIILSKIVNNVGWSSVPHTPYRFIFTFDSNNDTITYNFGLKTINILPHKLGTANGSAIEGSNADRYLRRTIGKKHMIITTIASERNLATNTDTGSKYIVTGFCLLKLGDNGKWSPIDSANYTVDTIDGNHPTYDFGATNVDGYFPNTSDATFNVRWDCSLIEVSGVDTALEGTVQSSGTNAAGDTELKVFWALKTAGTVFTREHALNITEVNDNIVYVHVICAHVGNSGRGEIILKIDTQTKKLHYINYSTNPNNYQISNTDDTSSMYSQNIKHTIHSKGNFWSFNSTPPATNELTYQINTYDLSLVTPSSGNSSSSTDNTGIAQKVQDLSNTITNILISNNDASFNNVDIVGELNITGNIETDTGLSYNPSSGLLTSNDISCNDISCNSISINGNILSSPFEPVYFRAYLRYDATIGNLYSSYLPDMSFAFQSPAGLLNNDATRKTTFIVPATGFYNITLNMRLTASDSVYVLSLSLRSILPNGNTNYLMSSGLGTGTDDDFNSSYIIVNGLFHLQENEILHTFAEFRSTLGHNGLLRGNEFGDATSFCGFRVA